jgi:acetyltransferase-like isoleucine patch superfamily enzyme
VYNRPDHARRTLEALAANDLADQSTLYIYADGPKCNTSAENLRKIAQLREVIRSRQWCKEVIVVESEFNKGLADSIVSGVTEVVNRHGRVIVLEDDIVTRKGFLRFMNEALEIYADDPKVMHVSGMVFGTPNTTQSSTAFLRVLSCNGWGTWKRAWDHYVHNVDVLIQRLAEQNIAPRQFDIDGGATFYQQLINNKEGRIYTWAVRWYASWLTAGGYSLFPSKSLLTNIGNDGTGVHSPAPFYNGETVEYLEVRKQPVQEDLRLRKEIDLIWRKGRRGLRVINAAWFKRVVRRKLQFFFRPIRSSVRQVLRYFFPELNILDQTHPEFGVIPNSLRDTTVAATAKVCPPYHISESMIGNYSCLARNSWVSQARIGKFCSIGPGFCCGCGTPPVDGVSNSPMFYSTLKQNGTSLSGMNKVQDRKPVTIGNDVFIGMNVTILDGVTVGDGAVIGAGCVVSKDVPPYAIVVGCPMRILRFRFPEETIQKLMEIAWWNWPAERLPEVERHFFDVAGFISGNLPSTARTLQTRLTNPPPVRPDPARL